MFVIAGITGQTGGAAAGALLAAGHRVRAFVRDPSRAAAWAARGVEVVAGDIADAASLERALAGAQGAYLLAPPQPAHPDPVGSYVAVAQAVRTAVQRAGLERLVFLSSEGAHLPAGTGPIRGLHRAEEILAGAAPRLTFLRAAYFQDNWRAVLDLAAAQGILPTMLGSPERKRAMVATADIGRVAADLLTGGGAPAIVELSGPQDYSAEDAAAAMSAALGRPVKAVEPPREAWTGILRDAGVGAAFADLLAEMYDGIAGGQIGFSGEGEARRGATTLGETVAGWVRAKAA
ncbi:NmrA family NAD(P)-binding protein [Salinarimonas soli]|nr:NAD(P)H-binding protein [Salinarimonas soli]